MGNLTINDIKDSIELIASIIIGGGTICLFAMKVGRGILKKELEPFNKRIDELEESRIEQHEETKREIGIIKEELNRNSLNTMKNTICNENIPLSERVSVGEEYISKGGNGAVKVRVHKLKEQYEKELSKSKKEDRV